MHLLVSELREDLPVFCLQYKKAAWRRVTEVIRESEVACRLKNVQKCLVRWLGR